MATEGLADCTPCHSLLDSPFTARLLRRQVSFVVVRLLLGIPMSALFWGDVIRLLESGCRPTAAVARSPIFDQLPSQSPISRGVEMQRLARACAVARVQCYSSAATAASWCIRKPERARSTPVGPKVRRLPRRDRKQHSTGMVVLLLLINLLLNGESGCRRGMLAPAACFVLLTTAQRC